MRCGCFYSINNSKSGAGLRRPRHQNYLWVCSSDGVSSHISIMTQQPHQASQLKTVQSFHLVETKVTCMEFVKGVDGSSLEGDSVWMGTDSCRYLDYLKRLCPISMSSVLLNCIPLQDNYLLRRRAREGGTNRLVDSTVVCNPNSLPRR